MHITNIEQFLKYHSRIKYRTRRLFDFIPPDKIEWTDKEGKFTIGDLIRHMANIERYLYAETVQFRESRYTGCGIEYAEGLENVKLYYDKMCEESQSIFKQLSPADLTQKCRTPFGAEITVWKWLRALIEHEIHHRGQIYLYLVMNDIDTPPLFGLTSEEVIESSAF